ncbi:cell wall hydrolase [Bacillus sp. FJAT-44742]|uniref:cell wall hydrolase n=1 Tax=Bacillus sp. FJAT-44742 TaxID=2014005 RepID=UPI000C237EB0|nr:cell wall hydrolase [Bacillus sp. FJAT-44742]
MKKRFTIVYSFLFALTLLLLPTMTEQAEAQSVLQKGSEGPAVTTLQQKLVQLDYLHTSPTGYYGSATEEAVRQFQAEFSLGVDGIAGPGTLHKLKEVEKMARVVHGEARGEPYKGQVAVAAVVKNRLHSSEFPNSVEGVIHQRNAFTAVHDGQYALTPDSTSYQAVRDAYQGWDPSKGATYYYNPAIATSEWIFTRTPSHTIGKHLFAN